MYHTVHFLPLFILKLLLHLENGSDTDINIAVQNFPQALLQRKTLLYEDNILTHSFNFSNVFLTKFDAGYTS